MNFLSFTTPNLIRTELDAALYILIGILSFPCILNLALRWAGDVKSANLVRKFSTFFTDIPFYLTMGAVSFVTLQRADTMPDPYVWTMWALAALASLGMINSTAIMVNYYLAPPTVRRVIDYKFFGGPPPLNKR